MANLNIAIAISAQDQASGPIGRIKNTLSDLGSTTAAGFSGLQTLVGGALVGIGAAGVGAMALIGKAAFGVANDVQAANNVMVAQFGATAAEAEHLANIARDVWGNNFAGSIEEAAGAIGLVRQQLGDLADDELQRSAENAFRLQDVFQVDIPEGIATADVLMEQFGLTSDQAFDFIAKGFQEGLNANGDFIDSIGEYSNLFADAGFSADDFFSIMESGAAGGVLGTDKISDAIKEMQIRLSDGGTDVAGAFDAIGLNFSEIQGFVASGDESWADYFDTIVGGLAGIEDPIARNQAQVAIFGTMAEDLGVNFTDGLSTATTSLEDMEGAVGSLDAKYNNLRDVATGFGRRALLAIEPIGTVMLNLANSVLPLVDQGFAFIEANVIPAIETAAGFVQLFFDNILAGQEPLTALQTALSAAFGGDVAAQITGIVTGIQTFMQQAALALEPITTFISQFVEMQDVFTALGIVVASIVLPALGSIVIAAAPVIAVGAALIAGVALVRNAWENNWGGIQEKTQAVIDFIVPFLQGAIATIRDFWAANGQQILATAQTVWQTISDFISTTITFISTTITTVATAIQDFWQVHGDTILATAQTIWQAISDFIGGILDTISAVYAAFRAAFEGDWVAFGENLRLAWDTAWETILDLLRNLWSFVQPILTDLINDILDKFRSTDWGSIGRGIIDGVANSIRSGAGKIADAAKAAARAALDAAMGFLGISSPSTVAAARIGAPFVEGITAGIQAAQPALESVVAGLFQNLQTAGAAGVTDLFSPDTSGSLVGVLNSLAVQNQAALSAPAPAGTEGTIIGALNTLAVRNQEAISGGLTIHVDARGSTLTRSEVEQIVTRSLRRAGIAADARRRSG